MDDTQFQIPSLPLNKSAQALKAKYNHMLNDFAYEGRQDGYWVLLKPNYVNRDGGHEFHEWNLDVLEEKLRLEVTKTEEN